MKNHAIPFLNIHSKESLLRSFSKTIFPVLILFFVSNSVLFAQSNDVKSNIDIITTDAYTADNWKLPTDYNKVLVSEIDGTTLKMTDPNLTIQDQALYTGYLHLLNYMQQEIASKDAIENVAKNNLNKVLLEAQTDPLLLKMSTSDFYGMYNDLVGILIRH